MKADTYWVYIILCSNNTFYTGITVDLDKRYELHQQGLASKYTRSFKPIRIMQNWKLSCSKSMAMRLENYIKKLSRTDKEKLIATPSLLTDYLQKLISGDQLPDNF